MNFVLKPWQLVLIVIAGWMNREQQEVIEYLRAENAVLREKRGKRRILLSDDPRRRMAVKGKILGYKRLFEVGTLLFGEKAMCNSVREYLAHYHTERNHQGLDNELIVPLEPPPDLDAEVKATERLGGLLRPYRRAA
jgi:hypothetical protein